MVSSTAEYALRAAVFLAQHPERPWTARDIAAEVRVPGLYLSKVLQQLARAGIVRSQRGLGGGFSLQVAPGKVSVLDILDATGNAPAPIAECPLGITGHTRLCGLHNLLDDTTRTIRKRFRATTLASLIGPGGRPPLCEPRARLTRSKPTTSK